MKKMCGTCSHFVSTSDDEGFCGRDFDEDADTFAKSPACNKYHEDLTCQTCELEVGQRRMDQGLSSGIHCDKCWNKMISECRSRSW
jgi:hypothetical protein